MSYVTRYRDERFKYLASALQQSQYDIIGLQEVFRNETLVLLNILWL